MQRSNPDCSIFICPQHPFLACQTPNWLFSGVHLHWSYIEMATSPLWEETKNTDISPSCLQNLWPIFQSKSSADSCTSATAFNPFTAFVLEILWNNSCEVELGDQNLSHQKWTFQWRGSQPALPLHWHGNRPAAPMILQKFLSTWWSSKQDERKRNTHISPSCLQNL